jgi:hypothetical protein
MAFATNIPHLVTPEVIACETGIPIDQVLLHLEREANCHPVAMAGVIPVYERRAIEIVRSAGRRSTAAVIDWDSES